MGRAALSRAAVEAEAAPPREPAFTPAEFARRLHAVQFAITERGLDALVVGHPEHLYYLLGFQSLGTLIAPQLLVVPASGEPCLVVRSGERSNVWARSGTQRLEVYADTDEPTSAVAEVLRGLGAGRVGVEADTRVLTPVLYEQLRVAADPIACAPIAGLLQRLRAIKSDQEIAYIERAAAVSSIAVAAGIGAIAGGATDRDVAAAVWSALVLAGGEYPGLPPFISVGPETTLFHSTWSGQPIRRGDVVMLEVPGVVGRYLAPVARTAALGEPPRYVRERYAVACASLEEGIASLRPGVTCAAAYEAFARPYVAAGYDVPIKVGYSVGLTFPPTWVDCEDLNLLPGNERVLEAGMVFHTPRSVRVYGEQTPIVSETTLITPTGRRTLTNASRELSAC